MAFQDRKIRCADCGTEFTFNASEQEFFATKGYANDPKRCPACRQARRSEHSGSSAYRPQRQLYPAVCARCGKTTEVPFEPTQGRPVYCSDCYNQVRRD